MNRENNLSNKYSRNDKLYILAKVCTDNFITPNSTNYMATIIRVATSKLLISNESAHEYATDLTSAYHADRWHTILYGNQTTDETTTETPVNTTDTFDTQTPTLNTLKICQGKTTPVNHIESKHNAAQETDITPRDQAKIILELARKDIFNDIGRVSLAEVRYEFNDKTLRLTDIETLVTKHFPKIEVEQRPGNILAVYFDGKESVRDQRRAVRIVQPTAPPVRAIVVKPPVERYEKDAVYGSKDDFVGQTVEPCDEGEDSPEVE
jgi:hypothetical protein